MIIRIYKIDYGYIIILMSVVDFTPCMLAYPNAIIIVRIFNSPVAAGSTTFANAGAF